MISIKHGFNVIHFMSHLITSDKSRNTEFINGGKKLEALLVFADYSLWARGWNWIPMSFGSICDIQQRCNEMLAMCESEWAFERQWLFGWKWGATTNKKRRAKMGSAVWKRGVNRRCGRSAEWKRLPNLGWGVPTEFEERPKRRGCGGKSAEFNRESKIQTKVHQLESSAEWYRKALI